MADNIEVKYKAYLRKPGSMQLALANINSFAKESYENFKRVVDRHQDIGKAVIAIMANNFASHIVKCAVDPSMPLRERINRVSTMISPMYSLMYDQLMKEVIDTIEDDLNNNEPNK